MYHYFPVGFDGLFLTNGPGNPQMCATTITNLRQYLGGTEARPPIFGICLGHQLMSLAIGTKSYKMK